MLRRREDMDPAVELAPRERAVEPASGLAVASVVLGAVAVVLGVTLVWFFLAMPLGIAAIALSIGGLVVIPRMENAVERTTGEDLSEFERSAAADLGSLEQSLRNDIVAVDQRAAEVEARLNAQIARMQDDLRTLRDEAAAELP